MRREERVTVQGPVKEQQPDGMSHKADGWVGMRAKKIYVPKMGLSLLALCPEFHFSPEENVFVFGGSVVWPGGSGPPDQSALRWISTSL